MTTIRLNGDWAHGATTTYWGDGGFRRLPLFPFVDGQGAHRKLSPIDDDN